MRRAPRRAVIGAAILVLIAAYGGVWWFAAGKIREGLDRLPEIARAHKIEASWRSATVGGFPFSFRVELGDVIVRRLEAGAGGELHLPSVAASAPPWRPRVWEFAAAEGLSATLGPTAKIAAARATGAVSVAGDNGATIWLTLDGLKLTAGEDISARSADAWLVLPARQPEGQAATGMSVAVLLHGLGVPFAPAGFAGTIDSLGAAVRLIGAVPSGMPPRQAAAAWRDGGGALELDHLSLRWGDLGVTGSGTLALDGELQPTGSISGGISGYDPLMNALVASGRIKPNDARMARMALAFVARPGPEGRAELPAKFTIQNGEMLLGPVKLGRAPRIEW